MLLDVFAVIQSVMRSFRTGAGLTNGHPRKFSCQRARYLSKSLAFTYSQCVVLPSYVRFFDYLLTNSASFCMLLRYANNNACDQ